MSLTPQQFEQRRGRLGASQIAALTDHSKWLKPIDVYRQVVEGWQTEQTEQMEIGTLLEPVVLELYRRRTGAELVSCGTVAPDTLPFACATPDALASPDKCVEAKTCWWDRASEWGEPGTDEVPPQYLIQAQWQMHVLRAASPGYDNIVACDIPVLISGTRFAIYTVAHNAELCHHLEAVAQQFYEACILPKRPPAVDDSESYRLFLSARWQRESKPLMAADHAMQARAVALREVRERRVAAEAAERLIANEIKAQLADAEGVVGDGFAITWKASKRGRVFRVRFNGEEDHE